MTSLRRRCEGDNGMVIGARRTATTRRPENALSYASFDTGELPPNSALYPVQRVQGKTLVAQPDGSYVWTDQTNAGVVTIDGSGIDISSDFDTEFMNLHDTSSNWVSKLGVGTNGLSIKSFGPSSRDWVALWVDFAITSGQTQNQSLFDTSGPVGYIVLLHCVNTSDGSSLGHIIGTAAADTSLFATTSATTLWATSITPSVKVQADGDLQFASHASINTRFVGLVWAIII